MGYLSLLPAPAPSPSQPPGFVSWTGSSLMPSDLGRPNQAGQVSQGAACFLASLLQEPLTPSLFFPWLYFLCIWGGAEVGMLAWASGNAAPALPFPVLPLWPPTS